MRLILAVLNVKYAFFFFVTAAWYIQTNSFLCNFLTNMVLCYVNFYDDLLLCTPNNQLTSDCNWGALSGIPPVGI